MGEANFYYFTCLNFINMENGRVLELAMGGIYFLSGLSKLLPIPSMVEQFDQFAEHFPFGLKPPGWLFLRSIGVAEAIGGYTLLTENSNPIKIAAATAMMAIMMGAWHTLHAVGEDAAMFVPSVVCFSGLGYLIATKYSHDKPKSD